MPEGQTSRNSYHAQLTTPGLDVRIDPVEVQAPDAPVHHELKCKEPCDKALARLYEGALSPRSPAKGTWTLKQAGGKEPTPRVINPSPCRPTRAASCPPRA